MASGDVTGRTSAGSTAYDLRIVWNDNGGSNVDTNQTYVYAYAYLVPRQGGFDGYTCNGWLNINGVRVGTDGGTKRWGWLTNGASYGFTEGGTWVTHNTDGTKSVSIEAYFDDGTNTVSYTPKDVYYSIGAGLTDLVRPPKAPTAGPTLTRSSDGSTVYITSALPTAYTIAAPTVTRYDYQWRIGAGAWTTVTGTSSTTLPNLSVTPNVTYEIQTRAANSEGDGPWSASSSIYGVPSAPTLGSVTQSTTDSGKIRVNWTAPTNTQGGLTGFRVYCNGNYVTTTSSSATFYDFTTIDGTTSLTVGTNYTFYVIAQNAIGYNASTTYSQSATSSNVMAPGIPSSPTFGTNPPTKVGRNVTVTVTNDANGYGNAVSNYYVQYRSAATSGGTYSSWSTPVVMTTSGGNKTYTYNLLPAALWYQFRVYAKNSIVNNSSGVASYYPDVNSSYTANFSPSTNGTTTMFVSAGGRRYRGTGETNPSTYQPTETAKRYGVEGAPPLSQTVKYWDLTNAKRYNGTAWVDLT